MLPIVYVIKENQQQEQILKQAFERMVIAARFGNLVDLSDLDITQQQVKNIYAWMINHLSPLFSFLNMPQQNTPQWFFQKDEKGNWNKKIQIRAESHLNALKQNANALAAQLADILTYLPKTNNVNDYIYWAYSFIANWITYSNSGNNIDNLVSALLNRRGLCEAYARISQLFFNIFDIDAIYQTGTLGSGVAKGPHVWNKFKINNQWFNFDTTSASTANKAYYLNPIGDFLSFNDTDFATKRTQTPSWYEPKQVANFNTQSLSSFVPYLNQLKNKKSVYKNKWYYLDRTFKQIVETDLNNQKKTVIATVNEAEVEKANNVYLVGDKLYWPDRDETNHIVLYEYDLETKIKTKNDQAFNFTINSQITSTKLDSINELSVSIYDNGLKTQKIKLNTNYNFFENNKSHFVIRAMAAILSLWFTQFNIGTNQNDFPNATIYGKYQKILIQGLTTKTYTDDLYNELINFKNNVLAAINQNPLPTYEVLIPSSQTLTEYDNLEINPEIIITNQPAHLQISYQWLESEDGLNWIELPHETRKDLIVQQITKKWNNKKVKLRVTINDNNQIKVIDSNICTITIINKQLPQINLSYQNHQTEWSENDIVRFTFNFSSTQNLDNIKIYKKQDDVINEIGIITNNQTQFDYAVQQADLTKTTEFYLEANFFDKKIQSNPIQIEFTPKLIQTINGQASIEINHLTLDSKLKLAIKTDVIGLNYQWEYDPNYFKPLITTNPYTLSLQVIKDENIKQTITCKISNDNFSKVLSFTVFINKSTPLLPKTNNLAMIIGLSTASSVIIFVIITAIIIILKKKKN